MEVPSIMLAEKLFNIQSYPLYCVIGVIKKMVIPLEIPICSYRLAKKL